MKAYCRRRNEEGPQDLDNTLFAFVSSCVHAGEGYALNVHYNFTSPGALLTEIDKTIDRLYAAPAAVYGLAIPAVATAANLRVTLLKTLLRTSSWPLLAELLSAAFQGDFSVIVNRTMPLVSPSSAGIPDASHLAGSAIFVSLSTMK